MREFERQLRYTAIPVREWLKKSGGGYSDLPFIQAMLSLLCSQPLEVAWRHAITAVSDFQKADIDILCALGTRLGKSDLSAQLQCVEETLEALEEQSRTAAAISQKTEKLYLTLGASGGLVVAMLLL